MFRDEITFDRNVHTRDSLDNIQGVSQGESRQDDFFGFLDFVDVSRYQSLAISHFSVPANATTETINGFIEVGLNWWDGTNINGMVDLKSDVPIAQDEYRWHMSDNQNNEATIFARVPVKAPLVEAFWFWAASSSNPLAVQTWAYGSYHPVSRFSLGSQQSVSLSMRNWADGTDNTLLITSKSVAAGTTSGFASAPFSGKAVFSGFVSAGSGTVTVKYVSGTFVPSSIIIAQLTLGTTPVMTTLNIPRGSLWFEFKNTGTSSAVVTASLIGEET